MRRMSILSMVIITLLVFFSGCQVIGDIFKAGVWVGILIVVVIIALIVFVLAKISGGK